MVHLYTMEYYSAIKRNAFESVLMRWMNVDPITHSEVSHKETYVCPLKKGTATHSNILAWKIPRTEEAGRVESMVSQKSQTCLK